jgi:hypothetical protein
MRSRTICALAAVACSLAFSATASAAPPGNDDFERAAPIGDLPAEVTGTVTEATTQHGEPAHGVSTVWYAFRPTASGRVAAELPSYSGMDAVVAVYTGGGVGSLERVALATDGSIRAAFEAVAGTTYSIAVTSGFETESSSFRLRIRPMPLPANDAFADARTVRIPGEYTGVLADATGELGEPRHAGQRANHSVWFRIRPRRTGKLTIDTVGSSCTANLAAYTGSDVSRLREVASTGSGPIRFVAKRGRRYHIAVNCRFPGFGDYVLTVSDGSIRGKGVTAGVDSGQTVDSVRSRGLRMGVSTKREVIVGIELRVRPAVARALGLDSPVLGRARGRLKPRQTKPAVVRLSSDAARALRGEDELSAFIRVRLLKTSAPNRVLDVPFRLPS